MLAAPTTPPALVALEWGSALEETLAARRGLAALPAPTALVEGARDAGLLGPSDLEDLRRIVLRLADVQSSMAGGARDARRLMSAEEATSVAARARRLLEALAARGAQ